MSIESLLNELNPSQYKAATFSETHALVLAGAGCGKTKTIIARAAFLISNGVSPERIQILTFTRRSASEIVERVRLNIGDRSHGLRASTFHTWATSIIRTAPDAFGIKSFTVIDRDDQIQLFKIIKGNTNEKTLPPPATICDIYSLARNTRTSLSHVIQEYNKKYLNFKDKLAIIMKEYEHRKRTRNYLDYDDILDIFAQGISQFSDIREWIGSQFDHILVDEMQDTNPLQWAMLEPLTPFLKLFCVGDDAQSIYGFRGADFQNVHSFHERIPNSIIFKLEDNYRSTQEILDLSNWLLSKSTINYDKKLRAIRGTGIIPSLHTFSNEWEEGRWIAEDILKRFEEGASWHKHMILVRSTFSARKMEHALLAKEIPYRFIGGTSLLESAHVKDVLSALRVIGNHSDEIGWMRFLTLWPGLGEVTASKIVEEIIQHKKIEEIIEILEGHLKVNNKLINVLKNGISLDKQVSKIIKSAVAIMNEILEDKYKNLEWDKRKKDFIILEKLAEEHDSILEFLEEYILEPIYNSQIEKLKEDDKVTIITIHSAKGTESDVCYILNTAPGQFPSSYSIGNKKETEEERRILYVALTRARNELILTRSILNTSIIHKTKAISEETDNEKNKIDFSKKENIENYFLHELPIELADEKIHVHHQAKLNPPNPNQERQIRFGIEIDCPF